MLFYSSYLMSSPEQSPSVEILMQYVKDLSVENPSPVRMLGEDQKLFDTSIDIDVQASSMNENTYEIVVFLRISIKKETEVCYLLEIQFAALSKITDTTEDVLPLLLFVQCPYLMFPYMRMLVTVLTQESGLPPLTLHPVDFAALLNQRIEQNKKNQANDLSSKETDC